MKVLKADHDRRIDIPGVAGPVRRPVDIDQAKTGFKALRTLRIYRFDLGAKIDGHAEEDEVYLIVLAGTIKLKINSGSGGDSGSVFVLSAPGASSEDAFVAYLPALAAYELSATTEADVAYARATPLTGRPAAIFCALPSSSGVGLTLLLEQDTYAERLRMRVLQIDAEQGSVTVPLGTDQADEALVHLRTLPADNAAAIVGASEHVSLQSWDTIAMASSDSYSIKIAAGASALILIVSAV